MAIIKQEFEIAKEAADVMDLFIVLAKDIKEKKGITAIGSDALTKLIPAIEGAANIPDEAKEKLAFERTIGLKIGELVAVLTTPNAPAVEPVKPA